MLLGFRLEKAGAEECDTAFFVDGLSLPVIPVPFGYGHNRHPWDRSASSRGYLVHLVER